jgi:hypothetical protein
MNKLYEWVRNLDPLFTLIGLILGVVGLVLSVIFFYRSRHKRNATFSMEHFPLISDNLQQNYDKLEIYYDKQIIKDLSATYVSFWNSGNVTIDRNDIAEARPLCLKMINQHKFFDVEVIKYSDKANGFHLVKKGESSYYLNFDFLESKEGFTLKILHSGGKDAIQLEGKIKGIKSISQVATDSHNESDLSLIYQVGKVIVALMIILMAGKILIPPPYTDPYSGGSAESFRRLYDVITKAMAGILTVLVIMFIVLYKPKFTSTIPTHLRKSTFTK